MQAEIWELDLEPRVRDYATYHLVDAQFASKPNQPAGYSASLYAAAHFKANVDRKCPSSQCYDGMLVSYDRSRDNSRPITKPTFSLADAESCHRKHRSFIDDQNC